MRYGSQIIRAGIRRVGVDKYAEHRPTNARSGRDDRPAAGESPRTARRAGAAEDGARGAARRLGNSAWQRRPHAAASARYYCPTCAAASAGSALTRRVVAARTDARDTRRLSDAARRRDTPQLRPRSPRAAGVHICTPRLRSDPRRSRSGGMAVRSRRPRRPIFADPALSFKPVDVASRLALDSTHRRMGRLRLSRTRPEPRSTPTRIMRAAGIGVWHSHPARAREALRAAPTYDSAPSKRFEELAAGGEHFQDDSARAARYRERRDALAHDPRHRRLASSAGQRPRRITTAESSANRYISTSKEGTTMPRRRTSATPLDGDAGIVVAISRRRGRLHCPRRTRSSSARGMRLRAGDPLVRSDALACSPTDGTRAAEHGHDSTRSILTSQ